MAAATFGIINNFVERDEQPHFIENKYPVVMTPPVMSVYVMAATTAFIFGYEIGIFGGVSSMKSFLNTFFPSISEDLKKPGGNLLSSFCDPILLAFNSSLYVAALVAWLLASPLNSLLGMRMPMVIASVSLASGASLHAAATAVGMLIGGRLLLGFGIGLSLHFMPLYVSEMTPLKHRPILLPFQALAESGVFVANLVNLLANISAAEHGWRVSLGGAIFPSLAAFVSVWFLPADIPSWMLERGESTRAGELLRHLRPSMIGDMEIERELKDMMRSLETASKTPWTDLICKRRHWPYLVAAVLVPLFQQLTGIGFWVMFCPILLRAAGTKAATSLAATLIGASCNLLMSIISNFVHYGFGLVEGLFLFYSGLSLMVPQILLGYACNIEASSPEESGLYCMTILVLFFIFYGVGCGPFGWLLLNEWFPLEVRSAARQLSLSVAMISSIIVAQCSLPIQALRNLVFVFLPVCPQAVMLLLFLFRHLGQHLPRSSLVPPSSTHIN